MIGCCDFCSGVRFFDRKGGFSTKKLRMQNFVVDYQQNCTSVVHYV